MILCVGIFALGFQPATAQDVAPEQAEIAAAVQQLKSGKFKERQEAFQSLVDAGEKAIGALEDAAKSDDVETAARTIEILTIFTQSERTSVAAIAALERIAKVDQRANAASAAKAKAALVKVKMTDKDRALAYLQRSGAEIRRKNGVVSSVTVGSDAQLAVLKDIGPFMFLNISGKDVTDDGIGHLAKVERLRMVTIRDSAITGVGIGHLKDLPAMETLSLSRTNLLFRSEDLRQLKQAKQLRALMLNGRRDDLDFVSDLKQVTSISLGEVTLTRANVNSLNERKNIKRLTFTLTEPDDAQIKLASEVNSPITLTIMRATDVSEAGWKHLRNARIAGLNLMLTSINDDVLKHIGASQTLQSLMIYEANITDAGLAHLKNLKSLSVLSLRDTQATRDGIAKLRKSLPNLRLAGIVAPAGPRIVPRMRPQKEVHFVDNSLGGKNAILLARLNAATVAELKQQANLHTIMVADNCEDDDLKLLKPVTFQALLINSKRISDAGLRGLEEHKTLAKLDIWESSITDAGVDSLAKIPQLTSISISKANLTDSGLQRLMQKLGKRNQLASFGMNTCPKITAAGFTNIDKLTQLETISLGKVEGLTSEVLFKVGTLARLQLLSLDGLKLDEKDLASLTKLEKLETLILTGLADSRSANEAVTIVSRISSLKALTISSPGITDACAPSLAKLENLEWLGLSESALSDEGLAVIAANHPNLVSLQIADTDVTDAGMQSVGKLTKLAFLDIRGTEVGDAGLQQLNHLAQLKSTMASAKNITPEGQQRFEQRHPGLKLWAK